jgi:hypothetical protein
MLCVGTTPGSAVPAVTASTRSTPESRSNAASSPVCALTAVTIIGLSGHCWRGNLAATIARRCSAAAGPRVGGVALQAERAHRTLQIGCRDGGSADGPHPLEHRGHRRARWRRPVLSDRWNRLRQNRSQQIGWRYAAAHLRCRGGPGRRADHQIGGLGHIDASFGQSCDDTDRPCMSGGPTTTENQSNAVNHLPTIAAQGHSRPSRYQDRA